MNYVNMQLAQERQIPDEDVAKIASLQAKRQRIEDRMKKLAPENVSKLRSLYRQWKDNEYELQSLWRFPIDSKYHKCFLLPHCKCPTLDNYAMYPHFRTVNRKCPYHGEE